MGMSQGVGMGIECDCVSPQAEPGKSVGAPRNFWKHVLYTFINMFKLLFFQQVRTNKAIFGVKSVYFFLHITFFFMGLFYF